MKSCCAIKMHMLLILILIISGLNQGLCVFNINLVDMLSDYLNKLFKINFKFNHVLYLIVAVVALSLAMKKTTWLPFLGKTVFPQNLIPLKTPYEANMEITIQTKPRSKVVYWAAKKQNKLTDVDKAYEDYSNAGVVLSDKNGTATLLISEGSGYKVPSGMSIPRHVHYRLIDLPRGMMGPIQTVQY